MTPTFHLPAGERAAAIQRVTRFLGTLTTDKAFRVSVEPHKPRRTLSQNALLWALYADVLRLGGESMAGWDKDDLHTFFCGECFGWEKSAIFGRARMRPLHGTSKLNKQQMSDFVDFVVRFMAEQGVVLEMPGDAR